MVLPIVKYGHPVLRQKGARIESIDDSIRQLIENMFETMYEASGIGLAAQQIGRPLQLTVLDVRDVEDRPSSAEIKGQPVSVDSLMPLVLINPEIQPDGPTESGPEGCLSFPEIYGEISRPGSVQVSALDREGQSIQFKAGGLLARAIQHEVDHLNGILFIDRMSSRMKTALQADLDQLRQHTLDDQSQSKS